MRQPTSPQPAVRFAWIAAAFILAGAVISSHAQGPNGKVSHRVTGTTEIWRIDEPNVKQKTTPYPQITFKPGDQVTVDAGGCVQTGGHGATWKRYVDPLDVDFLRRSVPADKYHGLIEVPGATPGLVRLNTVTGRDRRTLSIPQNFTSPRGLFLTLGYEDDGYGDNGYYSHDDGTGDQCKGVGNAFLILTIVHGGTQQLPAAAPFDLVWDSEDDNGIPLNPKWGWQITHPGAFPNPMVCQNGPHKTPCTTWEDAIKLDTADICKYEQYDPTANNNPPAFGVPGHANWAAGTFVGGIQWESHSCPCDTVCAVRTGACDDDYNFDFYPSGGASLTNERENIESEFDSDETIDHFNTPWWNNFHTAVDNYSSNAEVNQLWFKESNGTPMRYAILTGLIGLEFAHTVSTELHPVWAMAIRVKDDDPADEVWAMFVRRFGNEGFCSGDQHYLDGLSNDTYTFRLPWRPGASAVSIGSSTTFLANYTATYSLQSAPSQGVLVSFTAPEAGENRLNGELHLQWTGGQGPAPIPSLGGWPGPQTPQPCESSCAGDCSDLQFSPGETEAQKRNQRQQCINKCKNDCQRKAQGTAKAPQPEQRLASVIGKLAPAQQQQLASLTPKTAAVKDTQLLRQGTVTRIQSLPMHRARPRRVQFRSVPDSKKRARDQRLLDALHKNGVGSPR